MNRSTLSYFLTIYCLIVCVTFDSVDCLPRFIRGRRFVEPKKNVLNIKTPPEQYFDQRLDHFDESLTTTWKQRYWINDTFFDGNGPAFLMIGGEGTENPKWAVSGEWIELAKEFGALCVLVEHRYYGNSHPTEDLSTNNLIYLSSEQSLADLANIRDFIAKKYSLSDQTKWISFGGSYSGSLSAWLRLKYPHLFHAAIASSAPINAIVDFVDYNVVLNQSLAAYNLGCPLAINRIMKRLESYLESSTHGRMMVSEAFKTCNYIVDDNDVTNFYTVITGIIAEVVQYNRDIPDFPFTIESMCDILMNNTFTDLQALIQINNIYMNAMGLTCQDASYDSFIKEMSAVNWNESAAVGGRQWTYQTCIEFGFFQSTDSPKQPFDSTMPVEFFIQQCTDIFGPNFNVDLLNRAIEDTNTNYGSYNYQGTQVVFVNGRVDPWHALGFTEKSPNEFTKTVFINGTAHCADMYSPRPTDLPSLTQARAQIRSYLNNWL